MTALYRHFDAQGALLYVGITRDLVGRWRQHADAPWRLLVDRTRVTWFPTRAAAFLAEKEAIATEDPLWNVVGHPAALQRGGKPGRRHAEDQSAVRRIVRSVRLTQAEAQALDERGLTLRDLVTAALARRQRPTDTTSSSTEP